MLAENPTTTAYDVNTGETIFSRKCLSGEVVPSPACASGTVIVANDSAQLSAISLASGRVVWRQRGLSARHRQSAGHRGSCFDGRRVRHRGAAMTFARDDNYGTTSLTSRCILHRYLRAVTSMRWTVAARCMSWGASREFVRVGDPKLGEESVATPAFCRRCHVHPRKGKTCTV